jgi:tetratricopeptide (TPR) repeat protein
LAVAGARAAGALSRPDAALALLDGVADALPSASERCRAEAERVRGSCLMSYGNHDATERALERAARGFESVGDDRALASTLNLLGLVAAHRHDPTRAAACYARVLEVAERADLAVARGAALANLASLVPADRPRTERVALLERAVDALREASFAPALAATLLNLGRRRREAGVPGARAAFEEAAALMEGLGLAAVSAVTVVPGAVLGVLFAIRVGSGVTALRSLKAEARLARSRAACSSPAERACCAWAARRSCGAASCSSAIRWLARTISKLAWYAWAMSKRELALYSSDSAAGAVSL